MTHYIRIVYKDIPPDDACTYIAVKQETEVDYVGPWIDFWNGLWTWDDRHQASTAKHGIAQVAPITQDQFEVIVSLAQTGD